jgi:hypothetical protein
VGALLCYTFGRINHFILTRTRRPACSAGRLCVSTHS